MFDSWIEFYLYFCTITTTFSLYKLFLPCLEQIKKENDLTAIKVKSRPILLAIIFSLTSFIFAPMFLILVLFDKHAKDFITGFVKGTMSK